MRLATQPRLTPLLRWANTTAVVLPHPNWFNPLLRLTSVPNLRLFALVSKLYKLTKGSSSRVFIDSYRGSSRKYLRFDTHPLLFRKQQYSRRATLLSLYSLTPQNPWNQWTVRILSVKTSHKLVGYLPRRVVRGEVTSSFLTSNLELFRKQRRKRRRLSVQTPKPSPTTPLNRFRLYLKRKLRSGECTESSLHTRFKNLIKFKRIKKFSLRGKNLTRFRPYQFLGVAIPLRDFELSPSTFFNSMVVRFANYKSSSRFTPHKQFPLAQTRGLVTPSTRTTPPSFRHLTLFAFSRLPRKLKVRLRWLTYDTFINARLRRKRVMLRSTYTSYRYRQLNTYPPRLMSTSTLATNWPSTKPKAVIRRFKFFKLTSFSAKKWLLFFNEVPPSLATGVAKTNPSRLCSASRKSISLTLLRQFTASIRYAFTTFTHPTTSRPTQLATALLFSPYLPNSSKLLLRSALRRLNWTTHPTMSWNQSLMGTFSSALPQNFSIIGLDSIKSPKKTIRTLKPVPLRQADIPVFDDSPITFESFLTIPHQNLHSPSPTNLASKQPLLRLFSGVLRPLNPINTFNPSPLPPVTPPARLLPPLMDSSSLTPSYSKIFRQSHLFFVHLLVRPVAASLDLLVSSPYADPTFSFNVFPDANLIKVSVFRRLNRQKSLYEARRDFFMSLTLPYLYKSHTVKREERPLELYPSLNPYLLTRTRITPFYSSASPYRTPSTLRKSTRQVLKVQRVRFKPGYGRIWRQARASIREILNIPSRYQYRLTPKLQTRYTQGRYLLKPYSSLSLDYLLMASHLIPDCWVMDSLLAAKSIFLNGLLTQNPRVRVFLSDFIQLTINLKFFITLKWLRNWSELRQKRVTRAFYSKYRPSGTDKGFRFARPLPNWFFDLRFSYRSVPQILEVDFFTLSIFVIHDKLSSDPTEPVRANLYDASVLNMYNWKYIT